MRYQYDPTAQMDRQDYCRDGGALVGVLVCNWIFNGFVGCLEINLKKLSLNDSFFVSKIAESWSG